MAGHEAPTAERLSSFLHNGEDREDIPENEIYLRPGDKLGKGWKVLNLDKGYVPDWNTCDAFREFFQNWYVVCISC
jgi:hypothetical protein